MNEMLGNVNTSNALAAFEKMEEKGKRFRSSLFIIVLFRMHFLSSLDFDRVR
jgi:hypothetical protein